MSTVFPADYDTFVDPIRSVPGTPGSTLDNDHVGDHVLLNSAVAAVQVKLGKVGEVDPVSIEYRLAGAIAAADAAATDAISALANAALASSDLADHEADTGAHSISATVATAIAAHEAALDPHSIYSLETDLGTAAYLDAGTAVGDLVQVQTGGKLPALDGSALTSLPGGVSDHGALTGLADDDHTQYHTDARGDARYAPIAKGVTGGDSHNHDAGDGAQIAYASLSGLPTLGSAAAAATGDFEAAGTVSTHNVVTTAHGISAFGATLVDDTDASTARSTLGLGTASTTASTAYEASGAVSAHSGGTGVHTIAGVTGLQGALDAKAPTASPTFTGPVGGITAAMVGAPAGSGNSTGTNTGNETTTTIGALLNAATSKTTPVDADRVGIWNSVSGLFEYLSWANLKTALSGIFVLLAGKPGGQTVYGGTNSGDNLDITASSHATQGVVRINSQASLSAQSGTPSTFNSLFSLRDSISNIGFQIGATAGYGWIRSADILVASYANLRLGSNYLSCGIHAYPYQTYLDTSTGNFSVGVGGSGSARLHSVSTTEQLRLGYDASNYCGATTNSAGVTTFNLVGTAPSAKWTVSDATANAIYDVATFSKNSTGAGAAGLGLQIVLAAKSSTTADTPQAGIASEWVNATHATRTSRLKLSTNDYGGAREGIRVESDGAVPRLGFYGATAVVKPTALTATVSAAPVGGTGTAAGGWDTSTNRDLAIATINNLKTRVDQLETKLQALGLLT